MMMKKMQSGTASRRSAAEESTIFSRPTIWFFFALSVPSERNRKNPFKTWKSAFFFTPSDQHQIHIDFAINVVVFCCCYCYRFSLHSYTIIDSAIGTVHKRIFKKKNQVHGSYHRLPGVNWARFFFICSKCRALPFTRTHTTRALVHTHVTYR